MIGPSFIHRTKMTQTFTRSLFKSFKLLIDVLSSVCSEFRKRGIHIADSLDMFKSTCKMWCMCSVNISIRFYLSLQCSLFARYKPYHVFHRRLLIDRFWWPRTFIIFEAHITIFKLATDYWVRRRILAHCLLHTDQYHSLVHLLENQILTRNEVSLVDVKKRATRK